MKKKIELDNLPEQKRSNLAINGGQGATLHLEPDFAKNLLEIKDLLGNINILVPHNNSVTYQHVLEYLELLVKHWIGWDLYQKLLVKITYDKNIKNLETKILTEVDKTDMNLDVKLIITMGTHSFAQGTNEVAIRFKIGVDKELPFWGFDLVFLDTVEADIRKDLYNTNLKTLIQIQKYLSQWTKDNRFDLKHEITLQNTWEDVMEIVKTDMIKNHGFDHNIINYLEIRGAYGDSNLKNKTLNQDNIKNSEEFKTIRFTYSLFSNQWSKKIVFHVKNIDIHPSFVFDN